MFQYEDDVASSLFLLKCLNQVPGSHITKWFESNFQLHQDSPNEEAALAAMGERKTKRSMKQKEDLRAYQVYAGLDTRKEPPLVDGPLNDFPGWGQMGPEALVGVLSKINKSASPVAIIFQINQALFLFTESG